MFYIFHKNKGHKLFNFFFSHLTCFQLLLLLSKVMQLILKFLFRILQCTTNTKKNRIMILLVIALICDHPFHGFMVHIRLLSLWMDLGCDVTLLNYFDDLIQLFVSNDSSVVVIYIKLNLNLKKIIIKTIQKASSIGLAHRLKA